MSYINILAFSMDYYVHCADDINVMFLKSDEINILKEIFASEWFARECCNKYLHWGDSIFTSFGLFVC